MYNIVIIDLDKNINGLLLRGRQNQVW